MPPTPAASECQTACPAVPTCPPASSRGSPRLFARTDRQISRPLRSTPVTRASPLLRAGPPADAEGPDLHLLHSTASSKVSYTTTSPSALVAHLNNKLSCGTTPRQAGAAQCYSASGSELEATRARTARSATDKVVKVKRSL